MTEHLPPVGGLIERTSDVMAESLERRIEEAGWDQPPTLWGLRAEDIDDATRAELVAQGRALHGPPPGGEQRDWCGDLGPVVGAFSVGLLDVLDEHPFDALIGRVADRDVLGVALSVEGWDYPEWAYERIQAGEELAPPSTFPDRREVRHVMVVWRDGTEAHLTRHRGHEPQPLQAATDAESRSRISGRVPAAVRRVVQAPSLACGNEPIPDPRVAARQWWALTVAVLAKAAAEHAAELPEETDAREVVEFAMAHPKAMLEVAPVPAWAFASLVAAGPLAPEAGWEEVRVALAGEAPAIQRLGGRIGEETALTARLAAWADAEMVAQQFSDLPDATLAVRALVDQGVFDAVLADKVAAFLDPDAPFPDQDPDDQDPDDQDLHDQVPDEQDPEEWYREELGGEA